MCVCAKSFVTLWTIACKTPLSMEILQARILDWVAIPFSRGSFWCRDCRSFGVNCMERWAFGELTTWHQRKWRQGVESWPLGLGWTPNLEGPVKPSRQTDDVMGTWRTVGAPGAWGTDWTLIQRPAFHSCQFTMALPKLPFTFLWPAQICSLWTASPCFFVTYWCVL